MLLTAAILIAISSTMMEITLVHKMGWLDKLYTHGALGLDGAIWNVIGSILLSVMLGSVFAADGVTVLLGSALSGFMSDIYFRIERILRANGITIPRVRSELEQYKDQAIYWGSMLWKVLVISVKVITFPFWGPARIKNWFSSLPSNFARG